MSLIIWTERYDTGIEEVDIQHRKLVDLINTLFDTISQKDKTTTLNQILTDLINYSIYHFKLEEDLMLKHKFCGCRSHKKEHLLFVEKINELLTKTQEDDEIQLSLIDFLKNWLLNHILGADKEYASFILSDT